MNFLKVAGGLFLIGAAFYSIHRSTGKGTDSGELSAMQAKWGPTKGVVIFWAGAFGLPAAIGTWLLLSTLQ